MHTITLRKRTSKLQTTALKRKGLVNEFNNFSFKIKLQNFIFLDGNSKCIKICWKLMKSCNFDDIKH